MPPNTSPAPVNTSFQLQPGESVDSYNTRVTPMGGAAASTAGAPTTTPASNTGSSAAPSSATTTYAGPNAAPSGNDALAQSLGYANYAEAISKLTAPPQSQVDFYNNAYSAAGLADIQKKINSRNQDLAKATGTINDNPWLDETSRVGQTRNLTELANADISNWQKEYDSKLASVHDLVTQHTNDATMTDTANKARLSFLEAQAKQNADTLAAGPKTITGGDGSTYEWDPTTQSFKQIMPAKNSYQVVKGSNQTDAFGNVTSTPDRIFDATTGKWVDGGSSGGTAAGAGNAPGATPAPGTGASKLDFNQYGLLANTDLNPKSSMDQLAQKYLDSYLKDGTVPTYTSLGRGISPSGFAQVVSRAQDLYFKATGSSLPSPQIIKGNQQILINNNKLANNLKIQEQTVGKNVDLSVANMKKNDLNTAGFAPLNSMIDTVSQMFQDPNVGQLIAQNTTIQNELGSLLAVKNAAGTTVYDKLASAGIISSSDSQAMVTQKVNALLSEAANFADSLTTANTSLYKQIDPLMQDPNNPARSQYTSMQNDISHAIKDTQNFPTREALISALASEYQIDPTEAAKMVYSQWADNAPRK